jgi:AAHS family 4-hydroxybenzoate transporter-like MFS transporter
LGLPKAALGSALAAAQVGMLIGAISGGVVGDRFGRKAALVASTTLFGAGTLLIGFVHTPLQLASLRFAAGLGLGAAFPTVAALAAEFTPARHRSLAVILSIVCVPLGGVVGGMAASAILPVMGWQALFVLAGACTLGLALLLVLAVPESVTFLLSNGASPAVSCAACAGWAWAMRFA